MELCAFLLLSCAPIPEAGDCHIQIDLGKKEDKKPDDEPDRQASEKLMSVDSVANAGRSKIEVGLGRRERGDHAPLELQASSLSEADN